MTGKFDYFVVFAGMRTGSNYLERNINSIPDLRSFGELYNPYFISVEANTEEYLGITLEQREKDPFQLIERVRQEANGLAGFRLFWDHDARVRDAALADPRCAKIILTRNPVETYVSWKMALATDQWVLTDSKGLVENKAISFDKDEFVEHLAGYQDFLRIVRTGLQKSGQTAFELEYPDLQNLDVLAGLVKWLGSEYELTRFDRSLKKQNPSALRGKVENAEEMERALISLDPFGMDFTPLFEPHRGAAVPTYIASDAGPLLYQPIKATGEKAVIDWLEGLGGQIHQNMKQKELRQWMARSAGLQSFTVVRHPLARVFKAFVEKILPSDLNAFADIRRALIGSYKVPLPEIYRQEDFGNQALHDAFLAFLKWLRGNLTGQTSLRIDPSWCSQLAMVQGFASVVPPKHIFHEETLARDLAVFAGGFGIEAPAFVPEPMPKAPSLSDIYSQQLESAARSAYARDYQVFGFSDWKSQP